MAFFGKHKKRATQHVIWEIEGPGSDILQQGRELLLGQTYPNMDDMPELSASSVLANIEGLFRTTQCVHPGEKPINRCYSTVGPVLIATNPFEMLPCYTKEWANAFRNEGVLGTAAIAGYKYGPHCYCTSEQVYQALQNTPKQAVVICGESGAGKTFTNRLMMEYLLKADLATEKGTGDDYFVRIASANVLLESFGNAKTVRNDNSSRFGKLSSLAFDGTPLEARNLTIQHYLLEQSRVVHPETNERNYHILHSLAARSGKGQNYFNCVKTGANVKKADGSSFDDDGHYTELIANMTLTGFSQKEVDNIMKYLEAVLYLGNLEFDEDGFSSKLSAKSKGDLEAAASKLGLEANALAKCFCEAYVSTADGVIKMDVTPETARRQRDAFAKMLYSKVFDWIIRIMNNLLSKGAFKTQRSVGLLDIFGYEDMPINGLEQMFINLTNEQVQLLFNDVMIQKEMAIYEQEGICFTISNSVGAIGNNAKVVEMIVSERPQGIIAAITERIKQPGTLNDKDGEAFVQVLNKNMKKWDSFIQGNPKNIVKETKEKEKKWGHKIDVHWKECFMVEHYAGVATYVVRNFLSKSIDSLEDHISTVIAASTEENVRSLFAESGPGKPQKNSKRLAKPTVGEMFRTQLRNLTKELNDCQVCFVRCIKPSPTLLPQRFHPGLVHEQLICGGVVAALEMRKACMPDRLAYEMFLEEFWVLESMPARKRSNAIQADVRCSLILNLFFESDKDNEGGGADFLMGRTKIFFKTGILSRLRRFRYFRVSVAAYKIQDKCVEYLGKRAVKFLDNLQKRLRDCFGHMKDQNVNNPELSKSLAELQSKINVKIEAVQAHIRKYGTKDIAKVISTADLTNLTSEVNIIVDKVTADVQNMLKGQENLDIQLGKRRREIDAIMGALTEVSTLCRGEGEENEEFDKMMKDAMDNLSALLAKPAPKFMLVGQAECDAYIGKFDEQVAEAQALIDSVKTRFESVQDNRQKQMLEANPELADMIDRAEEQQEELERLLNEMAESNEEAFQLSKEAIYYALLQYDDVQQLWNFGAEPDVFLSYLDKYLQDGQAAMDTVQDDIENFRRQATSSSFGEEDVRDAATKLLNMLDLVVEDEAEKGGNHERFHDVRTALKNLRDDFGERSHVHNDGCQNCKSLRKELRSAHKKLKEIGVDLPPTEHWIDHNGQPLSVSVVSAARLPKFAQSSWWDGIFGGWG